MGADEQHRMVGSSLPRELSPMETAPLIPEQERAEAVRHWFREDPSRMTMMASRKFGLPEQGVVDSLVGQWPITRLREGVFPELMEALPSLGTMRVFVRSKAAIIEAVGMFGGYSESGPFFNVQTDTLDMHIFPAEIKSIYAVEKRGHDSEYVTHSFQFFDRQGDAGFKAYLWENYPDVPADRIDGFHELARRLAAP
jgi:putative hemin transport protein